MKNRYIISIAVIIVAPMLCIMVFATQISSAIRFILPVTLLTIMILSYCAYYIFNYDSSYGVSKRSYYKKHKKKGSSTAGRSTDLNMALLELPLNHIIINKFAKNTLEIEHMVIGPSGIFLIDSSNIRGKIEVTGYSMLLDGKRGVESVTKEIKKKSQSLKPDFKTFNEDKHLIKPVLCFTHAMVDNSEDDTCDGVIITSIEDIIGIISESRQILEKPEITSIHAYLAKNSTYASCRNIRS